MEGAIEALKFSNVGTIEYLNLRSIFCTECFFYKNVLMNVIHSFK